MSYSDSFPPQRPKLNLVFNGGSDQLDSRLSYSRSSVGAYLSNEKALNSENLLPYSNDLSGWSSSTTTAPSTNNLAPDGSNTATAVIENTATSGHNRYKSFSSVSGTNYTFLTFAKANGRTQFQVVAQATTSIANVKFDLTAVTSTVTSGSAVSHSIMAVGSTGWYKCEVTVTATGTGSNAYHQINLLDATGASSYTGDGTSGLFLWGMQVSSTGETVLNETSGQIHREFAPTLKTSAANEPRFEYASDGQSAAGSPLGLLIESQSTNYNTKSEDIAGWSTPSNMTVSASAMVAPNGTLTADVLTVSDDTVASGHFAYRASSDGTSGQTVAASFFAKTAGVNHIYFYDANTANAGADSVSIFDLNNGTIGGTNAPNCKMIDCGNGWWRCVSVYTLTGAGTSLRFYTTDNGSTTTYIGNGFDGFGLWGVQVEIGVSSESSYISTSGSTVSRASDSCSVDSATLFDNGGGTLYAEARRNGIDTYNGIASVDDGTGSGDIVQIFGNSTNFRAEIASGGTTVANIMASGHSAGVYYKHCVSFSSSAAKYYVDGSQKASTDTDLNIPSMSQMHLGMLNAATSGNLNGHIKRVALYNVALSDTELQAITS